MKREFISDTIPKHLLGSA